MGYWWLEWHPSRQEHIAAQVEECQDHDRVKRKQNYDQSWSVAKAEVGDHVMVKTHSKSKADKLFSAKLAPRWKGPFFVRELLTPVNLKLADVGNPKKEIIVHVDQTKPVPKS